MELLEPTKSNFLLEVPLEILHKESIEWIEEIEFWKDEVAFFYKLIITRRERKPPTKNLLSIQNQIIYFSSEKLDDLKLEIQTHERYLARLLKYARQDENAYRLKHKALSKKISETEQQFREMKKKIFLLVKKSSPKQIILNK